MLTQRDQQLLLALLLKVRLLSLRQIAAGWWQDEVANARRRLRLLAEGGLVRPLTVSARSLPLLENPLVVWQPDDRTPDFAATAHRLQSRWRRRAVRPTKVFTATPQAAQLLGGRGRSELAHPLQATHDLGVAAVWLRLRQQAPAWAAAWRGEDLLTADHVGDTRPDACIVDEDEEPVWAIEFGGDYDAQRLSNFHQDCQVRELPYQLW